MTSTDSPPVDDGSKQPDDPVVDQAIATDESNPDWLALLGQKQTSDLAATDITIKRKDKKAVKAFEDIEKDRLQQANSLRPYFFGIAAILALIAVGTSSAMVCGVVFGERKINDALGVAFITSLAVETLGILTIVGQYLFKHPQTSGKIADEVN
ncbi:hypothetical protein GS479_01235 [Rhodococcus hoagii]|nr:hypothetical protein [Prescottella equi]